MDNKNIFASNLNKYMKLNGKSRTDISEALGISYYTVSDWVKGKKYPRMDKVEMLANFFGIKKSDLIEEKVTDEAKTKNDIATDIVIRMGADQEFCDLVKIIYNMDKEQVRNLKKLLGSFFQQPENKVK